jgi:SRSO17 transposase
MKETTPAAMPPCFDRWCRRFDNCFKNEAQKNGFRQYFGGLLGQSERKNLTQMANNALVVVYNRLHHFLTESPWSDLQVNECRLQVMNQCRQTQIPRGLALIVDDSGHRKSGNLTAGVGRQYLGEIGSHRQRNSHRHYPSLRREKKLTARPGNLSTSEFFTPRKRRPRV